MDKQLVLTLKSTPSCEIYLEDSSNYASLTDVSKFSLVEYVEQDDAVVEQRVTPITSKEDSILKTSEPFEGLNGLQSMVRVLVPSIETYKEGSAYKVENKYFILDNEVYFSEADLSSVDKDSLVLIEDYSVLLDTEQSDIYSGKASIFSYCALKNCVLEHLKAEIQGFKKQGCDFGCIKQENYELKFLLESLYAVEMLVDQNKLSDAQRVLDTVMSCGSVCGKEEIENTDCGCGKA